MAKEECGSIKDAPVSLVMQHNAASFMSIKGDNTGALDINKSLLAGVRIAKDQKLEQKIKYGIAVNKTLRPYERFQDFINIQESMKELGHIYDSLSAGVEVAKALVEMAKLQQEGNKQQSYEQALTICKEEILPHEKEYGNPKVGILALELIGEILQKIGKNSKIRKEGKQKLKLAKKLRTKVGYSTPLWA